MKGEEKAAEKRLFLWTNTALLENVIQHFNWVTLISTS